MSSVDFSLKDIGLSTRNVTCAIWTSSCDAVVGKCVLMLTVEIDDPNVW